MVGLFGIGEKPTGDKDPFALRRHALGIARILYLNAMSLELPALIDLAEQSFVAALRPETASEVATFIYERLANNMREENNGYSPQMIDAVFALQPGRIGEINQRMLAARDFVQMPEGPALAAANKRVGNILKKVEGQIVDSIDPARFTEAAEHALYEAFNTIAPTSSAAFDAGDYTTSLQRLAALKTPIDAFFDQVMVNADDPAIRANRLALLANLYRLMNRVAELAKLSA
jgi:glycyl-tRNA synthetase beta chain